MAHRETDRDDLIREATALVRRAEFHIPGDAEPVVVGFRSNAALSVYFGGDPVYHFDAEGRLRRAFVDGQLYRTQGETLTRLRRVRTESRIVLHRQDLSPIELDRFRHIMRDRLRRLQTALQQHEARFLRCVLDDDDLRPQLNDRLEPCLAAGTTLAPSIPGKR